MEGSAPADDRDVTHDGAVEDVEPRRRIWYFARAVGGGQQHGRDVALADDGDVLRPMVRWGEGTRRELRVPVDERERGDDAVGRCQGEVQRGDGAAGGEEEVGVVQL